MKYSCECGISEAHAYKEKSYRLSAEMNYQYRFYWVPLCFFGHEMESLCENCQEQEKADGDFCIECEREQRIEEAEMAFDAQVENLLEAK